MSISEIKNKLKTEKTIQIYESKYSFSAETTLTTSTFAFCIITASSILLTNIPFYMKAINAIFFVPSFMIQLEYYLNNTRFIKQLKLTQDNKLLATTIRNKTETLDIKNLKKAIDDKRAIQKDKLNNEIFIIFTNQDNKALYHLPRNGIFLNEDLVNNILEGRTIDNV